MHAKIILAALAASVSASPLARRTEGSTTNFPDMPNKRTPMPSGTTGNMPMSSGTVGADPPAVPPPQVDAALISQLKLAPSAVERLNILTQKGKDPKPLKFDFNGKKDTGAGGHVTLADRTSMPALVDLGISSAVGFMQPCGMNTAHTHPRATEFLTVVEGTIQTGFIQENGFTTEINTELTKFQGTVFPMGSIHFQFNPKCEPATFVAGLNHENPGASTIAQNFFALDSKILDPTLGFPKAIDANNFKDFKDKIPASFAQNIATCLASCPGSGNTM